MVKMKQKVIWGPRLPGAIAGLWLMWHGHAYYREPWLNGNGDQVFASFELQGQGLMMFGLGMGIVAIVVACTTRLVPVDSSEERKRKGVETSWHENGQKSKEGSWQNGQEDGVWTYWHDNGQKSKEGSYKSGKKQGVWTEWHENGEKKADATWQNGNPEGVMTIWGDSGNVVQTHTYKNGVRVN
jgi:hypothetical protein